MQDETNEEIAADDRTDEGRKAEVRSSSAYSL